MLISKLLKYNVKNSLICVNTCMLVIVVHDIPTNALSKVLFSAFYVIGLPVI